MKTMKRILALLFALILVLSLLPAVAMADTSTWTFTMSVSNDIPSTATKIINGLGVQYTSIEDMVTKNELTYNEKYCFVVELNCTDHTGTQDTDQPYFSVQADKPEVKVLLALVIIQPGSTTVTMAKKQWTGNKTNQSSNPFTFRDVDQKACFWWGMPYDYTYPNSQNKAKLFVAVDPTSVKEKTTLTIESFNKESHGTVAGRTLATIEKKLEAYPAPAADAVTVGESETLTVTAGAASTNNGTTTSEVSVAVDNEAKATVSTSGEEVNSTNVNVESVVTGLVEDGQIHTGNNNVVFTLDKKAQTGATESSATYDVVPKLSVNGGDPVVVSNAQLTGPVTFKLRAPDGAREGNYVTALHKYDADANIPAGSETFKNLPVDAEGNVTLTLRHFSEVTLTLQNGVEPDAIIRSMNGYLADYFVLNFYVTTDVQNPRFAFNRAYDSKTLQQVSTKAAFCESNVAVYYVEYVEKGGKNALGLESTSSYDTYMVSVKFFTKFLDQNVTLSMTDANGKALNIQGYGYTNGGTTIGTSEVATSHSYSFTDFLHIMKLYQGSGYENLYNGLSAAALGARNIPTA